MLGVDEGRDATLALGLGHDVQGESRLAARFGAEDFHDSAVRNALAAQGQVEREAAGRDARYLADMVRAQGHDGPLAELLLDLGDGVLQRGMGGEHRLDVRLAVALLGSAAGTGGCSLLSHAIVCFRFQGGDHEFSLLL